MLVKNKADSITILACSQHDIAENIGELALNNNHSLTKINTYLRSDLLPNELYFSVWFLKMLKMFPYRVAMMSGCIFFLY